MVQPSSSDVHQTPCSLVLSSNMALESGKLCKMYTYMCVLAFKCLIFTHTFVHVLFHPPPLSLSLLHMHTHNTQPHTSIVHDELNDILNLLLVLVSFTLLPWTLATIPWMVNREGQGWELLALSPVSPIFSTHARKEGEPGIQNHVTNVGKMVSISWLPRC